MIETIKLNREIAEDYLKVLREANEAWFYDYHWSSADQEKLNKAIGFFQHINSKQKAKARKDSNRIAKEVDKI